MQLFIEYPVTIITPTIGSPKLLDAIESVKRQTYKSITHLLVVDGPEYAQQVRLLTEKIELPNVVTTRSPFNTGKNGFYGHRIYAAYPHLINTPFVFFLDEDNWYEPTHVDSLVKTIVDKDLDFAYSLRNICDPNKEFITTDDCESLGQWPIWFTHDNPQYMIDTSSFAFKREFLVNTAHLWHFGWGGDRRYFNIVKEMAKFDTSGKYTLNYRLDGNPNSVNEGFFLEGNAKQAEHYKEGFPWVRT